MEVTKSAHSLGNKLSSANKVFLIMGIVLLCSTDFFQSEIAPLIVNAIRLIWDSLVTNKKDYTGVKAKFKRNVALRASVEPFLDDSKSRIATEDELNMLETHGYDKYRYVSKSFIKRNKLLKKR